MAPAPLSRPCRDRLPARSPSNPARGCSCRTRSRRWRRSRRVPGCARAARRRLPRAVALTTPSAPHRPPRQFLEGMDRIPCYRKYALRAPCPPGCRNRHDGPPLTPLQMVAYMFIAGPRVSSGPPPRPQPDKALTLSLPRPSCCTLGRWTTATADRPSSPRRRAGRSPTASPRARRPSTTARRPSGHERGQGEAGRDRSASVGEKRVLEAAEHDHGGGGPDKRRRT